ncbi:RCC1 domain-containing protein [Methanocella conradii]|uniref:RCC1 domain-containing protein n=1 Tax=Methanocella conradii TaxID=1175444 RepID=UPI0024B33980|nr:hypothetical protein [Methanocella conradii]MDI6898057.1 hypothetical protein [Methanocella conradii]
MSMRRIIRLAILVAIVFAVFPCAAHAQKVVAVSIEGGGRVLMLMDDGTVYSLGSKDDLQKVSIDNVTTVSAGSMVSLALRSDGTVWAWGDNYYGGLGDGTLNSSSTPVKVKGLANVVAIAVGDGTCYALKGDGTVWAWGRNDEGQVGDGTLEDRPEPVQVRGLSNIIALGEGGNYAIKNDGTVWAWGSNDISEGSYGALGDNSGPGVRPVPFQVRGVSNVTQISNGGYHAIYVKDDGSVWGWGRYDLGQLGDGSTHSSRPLPVKPPSVKTQINNVKKVSGGSTALKNDGTVWEWGMFIGDPEPIPVKVKGLDHVVDISVRAGVKVALKDDGTVWGWGRADGGGLFGWPKVVDPNPAFNYVVERDPVLLFSGPVQPTITMNPTSMNVTTVPNSPVVGQSGEPGIPSMDMDLDIVLAALMSTAICLTKWRKGN